MIYRILYVALSVLLSLQTFVFAGEKERYVFWSASPYERVWMRSSRTLAVFEDDNRSKPVRILAGRNEYEERQFVITPRCDNNSKKIKLKVSELKDAKGHSIGKEHIQIEWVRYSLEFWKPRYLTSFVPDPLAPTNIACYDTEDYNGKVNEKTNTIFWVTFYVPKGTPAGIYRGKATAIIDNKVNLTRALELEVLDITLPVKTHTRTALFRGPFSMWLVKDLAEHRISFGGLPDNAETFVKTGRLMHKLGVQIAFVGPWLDVYDAMGVRRYYGRNRKKSPENALASCKKYYETYYPILKREGWVGEAYSRMPDEFSRPEITQRVREYVKKLRQWAPGIRTQTTGMPNRKSAEMLIGSCDIWSPSGNDLNASLDFYQERVKAGDEVWPYIHEVLFHRTPPINISVYFRILRKYGFTGCCYWSVGPRGKFKHTAYGVIRNDRGVWPGDGSLYYPAKDNSMTPPYWRSIRLALIRDGMEDLEYFRLMDQLVKKTGGQSKLSPEVKAKIKVINDFVDTFDTKQNTYPVALRACSTVLAIEANRREVAKVIIALQKRNSGD